MRHVLHVCVTDCLHLSVRQQHKTTQIMSKPERSTTENEALWVCVHEATTYLFLPFPVVDAVSFVIRIATLLLLILLNNNSLTGLSWCAPRRDVLTQQCHLSKLLSSWDRKIEKHGLKSQENVNILAGVSTFLFLSEITHRQPVGLKSLFTHTLGSFLQLYLLVAQEEADSCSQCKTGIDISGDACKLT